MHADKIVDLFAGPGGLDVAAHQLGVPAVGVEWDANACATRYAAKLETQKGDVRDFSPRDFPDATVLAGGPPCQTYTVAGNGAGRRALDEVLDLAQRMARRENISLALKNLSDERTGLVLEPLRWALSAISRGKPYKAIVLEQVPAVLPVWQAVSEILKENGYSAACGVLRTEEFGVPQTRRRAILIARRDGVARMPTPTHRPYRKGVPRRDGDQNRLPWVPMREALRRTEAFVVISNYGTGGDPKARGRRNWGEPSATITGKVSRNRVMTLDEEKELPRFTHAEAGILQSFPATHAWKGNDIAQQIGNAVPPRLAKAVLAAALDMKPDDGSRTGVPATHTPGAPSEGERSSEHLQQSLVYADV